MKTIPLPVAYGLNIRPGPPEPQPQYHATILTGDLAYFETGRREPCLKIPVGEGGHAYFTAGRLLALSREVEAAGKQGAP